MTSVSPMLRDSRLVTDLDVEPSPTSDDGRLLAFLESRIGECVLGYNLARVGKLQYNARCHSLRHTFGYVLINGEAGHTSAGRKKTWFALIGRLTRSQLTALEKLCREQRMRYNDAIVQVFPRAASYLAPHDRAKPKLLRNYPPAPQQGGEGEDRSAKARAWLAVARGQREPSARVATDPQPALFPQDGLKPTGTRYPD